MVRAWFPRACDALEQRHPAVFTPSGRSSWTARMTQKWEAKQADARANDPDAAKMTASCWGCSQEATSPTDQQSKTATNRILSRKRAALSTDKRAGERSPQPSMIAPRCRARTITTLVAWNFRGYRPRTKQVDVVFADTTVSIVFLSETMQARHRDGTVVRWIS